MKRKIERGIYTPIVDGAEAESKVRNDAVVGCNQYEALRELIAMLGYSKSVE